jgi:hypothetical protein
MFSMQFLIIDLVYVISVGAVLMLAVRLARRRAISPLIALGLILAALIIPIIGGILAAGICVYLSSRDSPAKVGLGR